MDSRFKITTLDNGLTVLFERNDAVPSVAAGFLVKTGARDETPPVQGVSHFLEHMMFKGTENRDAKRINIDFDEMGASYNAFTGNEETFYYGWVRTEELPRLLDLLADMMRSKLPAGEFETEKKVILEEIAMYADSLESHTFETLMARAFAGHPLGGSILGSQETVEKLTLEQMQTYFQKRYEPANMVLAVSGRFDPDETLRTIQTLCGDWETVGASRDQAKPSVQPGRHVVHKDRFERQTLCLVFQAPSAAEPEADVAEIAALALGKDDNSRLFWNITQKGLAQTARAFHYGFADAGMFGLWAVSEPDKTPAVLEALREHSATFAAEGPTDDELIRARNQVKTSFALEAEVPLDRLVQIAEDYVLLGRLRTPDERVAEFDRISVDAVRRYLADYPITGEGALVSVGPRKEL